MEGYNFAVPTPFYHLSIANHLLDHPQLPAAVARQLKKQRCAFLFGNTAADVQVVSGQSRQETHFFEMPLRPAATLPWLRMLAIYPQLACPRHLPEEQAFFLAGYLCHLLADWLWIKEIFIPVFGPARTWGTFSQRIYLHNVLRSYLDRQILLDLRHDTQFCLVKVSPDHWLPFASDLALQAWRDLLSPQLLPGAEVQTVEVFAARQGIATQEYYALLDSNERMQQEIFNILPLSVIEAYRLKLLQASIKLLEEYMDHQFSIKQSWSRTASKHDLVCQPSVNMEANRYETD